MLINNARNYETLMYLILGNVVTYIMLQILYLGK